VRGTAKFLICLVIASVAAPLMLPASAADGSLVIMAGYEQRSYSPGELMNFTLYLFYDGEALSPQDPPVVSVMRDFERRLYTVPVVESGRGRYSGCYTVLAADAEGTGGVQLMAEASYAQSSGAGTETAWAWMDVSVALDELPKTSHAPRILARLIESSDSTIKPGTSLAFQCCVTLEGRPADPEGLAFIMRHDTDGPGISDTISPQRTGPGSYIVRYRVPQLNRSDHFYLDAVHANASTAQYTGAEVGLDFFQVIYHELKRTGTRIDYELLVSDRDGAPVNASSVRLDVSAGYDYPGTGPSAGESFTLDLGPTDKNGRIRSLLDIGGGGALAEISGWANTSRLSQRFFGSVEIFGGQQEQSFDSGSGFRVVRTGMEGELRPGGTVRLTYRASSDGRLLNDVLVDCYIEVSNIDASGINSIRIRGLRALTDDGGRFVLNFSFPAKEESIAQVTFLGPEEVFGYRPRDYDQVHVVPEAYTNATAAWVNASFSRAEPQNPLGASVWGPGLAAASMGWRFDYGVFGSEQRDWSVWTSMEWPLVPQTNGSLPLKGRMVLPAHLRTGLNITVSMRMTNSSGETSESDFGVQVKAPQEPAAGNDLCCLAGAAVVNIALLAFVTISYLSAKKAPPRKQFGELDVDERIGDILNPPEGGPPGRPAPLPFRAQLVQSVECAKCGRKIAKGNMALGCACGRKFHEHCLGDERKCVFCGREWSTR
jgi:hypothetical protein